MANQNVVARSIAKATEIKELINRFDDDHTDSENSDVTNKDLTTLGEYAKTGQAKHCCKGCALVMEEDEDCNYNVLAVLPDGRIVHAPLSSNFKAFQAGLEIKTRNHRNDECLAVVVPGKDKLVEHLLTIVKLGDDVGEVGEVGNGAVAGIDDEPTISFRCLGRFFSKNPTVQYILTQPESQRRDLNQLHHLGVEALQKGKVLDFSHDERRSLTAAQKKRFLAVKKGNYTERAQQAKLKPPEAGFVLVGSGGWHRSGSFLITYKGQTVLLGVDDDAYFGCELVGNPKTLKEAYAGLVPEAAQGITCDRQGEWFAIPIKEKDIPALRDAIALGDEESQTSGLFLSRDNSESARHFVTSEDTRIAKDGVYAVNPTLSHSEEEHPELELKGWYRFDRNTAKRSFSEAGVD